MRRQVAQSARSVGDTDKTHRGPVRVNVSLSVCDGMACENVLEELRDSFSDCITWPVLKSQK